MDPRSARSIPPAVPLAVIGALLGAGAMLLPWFSVDAAGFARAMRQVAEHLGVDTSAITSTRLDALTQQSIDQEMAKFGSDLVGWRVFRHISVALHVLGAAVGLAAALKVLSGQSTSVQQRAAFATAGAVVALRPIIALVRPPGSGRLPEFVSQLGVTDLHLFNPAIGIWVALLGAVCLGMAAVFAHVGEEVASPEEAFVAQYGAPVGAAPVGGAHVPTPYMPSGVSPAAPAASAAHAQDAAAFATPSGAAYGVGAPPAPAYAPRAPYGAPPPQAAPYGAPIPPPPGFAPASIVTASVPQPGAPRSAAPSGPHVAMPVVRDDAGAYGSEGPGRLAQAEPLIRADDPYAPKHAAPSAAALAAQAAKEEALRAAGRLPVQPQPTAPTALPPRPLTQPRGGSVAPPGLG
jgi:hypothetical protein